LQNPTCICCISALNPSLNRAGQWSSTVERSPPIGLALLLLLLLLLVWLLLVLLLVLLFALARKVVVR
jgi:hypothetical protein